MFGFIETARPVPTMAILDANNVSVCMHAKAADSRSSSGGSDLRRYARHWTPVHLDLHVEDFDAVLDKEELLSRGIKSTAVQGGAGAFWPEKAGTKVGQLHVLDHLGRPLHELDLPPSFPAGAWNGALGAPTVANVDANPDLEVLVGTARAGLVAYRIPNTPRARVLWGTGRGNYQRTGTPAAP